MDVWCDLYIVRNVGGDRVTNLDRLKMLMFAAKDLEDAVKVYERAKTEKSYVYAGYNVPMHCGKEAIKRRITQMRQDLLQLEKGL